MGQIDLWAWFKKPLQHEPRNDHERELRAIVQLYYDGRNLMEREPEEALAIFEQARRRAVSIDEPCYELFFGYQQCEVCLYYLRDTVRGLDYATKLVTISGQSRYKGCVVVGDIYHAVVTAYLIIDPIGYANDIQEALGFLETEVSMTFDRQCIIQSNKSVLAYEFEQIEEAIRLGQKYLEMSEGYLYRQFHANLMLCEYFYCLEDVDRAFEHIDLADNHMMKLRRPLLQAIIDILAWKAVLEFRRGNESEAHRCYRQAVAKFQDFGRDPWQMYCTNIAEYLEFQGKIDQAIRLYDQTSVTVLGTGKHWSICNYWLERCRFMGRVGMPFESELKSAYEAGANLLKPELYLAKLSRVEAGDYSSRKIRP